MPLLMRARSVKIREIRLLFVFSTCSPLWACSQNSFLALQEFSWKCFLKAGFLKTLFLSEVSECVLFLGRLLRYFTLPKRSCISVASAEILFAAADACTCAKFLFYSFLFLFINVSMLAELLPCASRAFMEALSERRISEGSVREQSL